MSRKRRKTTPTWPRCDRCTRKSAAFLLYKSALRAWLCRGCFCDVLGTTRWLLLLERGAAADWN
jgi:hypothetical protein